MADAMDEVMQDIEPTKEWINNQLAQQPVKEKAKKIDPETIEKTRKEKEKQLKNSEIVTK